MNDSLKIDLIKEFELEELPLEEQAKTLESIAGAIMTAIVARIIPMLDENSQKEFNELLDKVEDPGEIQVFLSNKIPNFQEIADEEVANFKEEALDFYKKIG